MPGQEGIVFIFIRELFAAHEEHVLQIMAQTLKTDRGLGFVFQYTRHPAAHSAMILRRTGPCSHATLIDGFSLTLSLTCKSSGSEKLPTPTAKAAAAYRARP